VWALKVLFKLFKKLLDHKIRFTVQEGSRTAKLEEKVLSEVFKHLKRGAEI
jgi:hypothetical protein